MDLFNVKMSATKLQLSALKASSEYATFFLSSGELSASNAHMKIVEKKIEELEISMTTLERLHAADLRRNAFHRVIKSPVPMEKTTTTSVRSATAATGWQDEDEQLILLSLSLQEVSQWLNVFCFTKIKLKR
jgi:hypothetical protein